MKTDRVPRPSARGLLGLAALVSVLLAAVWLPQRSRGTPVAAAHDHGPMTAEAMERWSRAWYAEHPARGAASLSDPVDSFLVKNFAFDNGGAGQVDTAKIFQGQTVLFKWVVGTHTVTSGTGDADPDAGVLFDHPSDASLTNKRFSFQFDSVGTVPFFCRIHEFSNMKGVVIVRSLASVDPIEGRAPAGFVGSPGPNPTRGTVAFRFALPAAGRVRAEVFDVRGRRVATVLDRELVAGSWEAAWDGRAGGSAAAPGVYFLRLTAPGVRASRILVVAR